MYFSRESKIFLNKMQKRFVRTWSIDLNPKCLVINYNNEEENWKINLKSYYSELNIELKN